MEALKKEPNEKLQQVLPGLQIDLAHATLEANETELAKRHATETLQKNTDKSNDHYGNVIHNTNQILGRCALRAGKLADAKAYLLKAGATPVSPQTKSFGPQMQLARELLQKGKKETVLQYLHLVNQFWESDNEESALGKQVSKEHAVLIAGGNVKLPRARFQPRFSGIRIRHKGIASNCNLILALSNNTHQAGTTRSEKYTINAPLNFQWLPSGSTNCSFISTSSSAYSTTSVVCRPST